MIAAPSPGHWNGQAIAPLARAERGGHVRQASPFAAALLERHPQAEPAGDEHRPPSRADLHPLIGEFGLDTALRRFRNLTLLRIIWRDLTGLAALDETFNDLTALAEICLDAAIAHHHERLRERHGEPTGSDGEPLRLAVIGLGKFGGGELNLSSDIDLMFCCAASGECRGDASRPLSSDQFFIRLARAVIASLSEVLEEGFCFRVDTRLRPFGDAGPLCASLAALEQYYQREGRDWERYALIKARPVAGDRELGARLMRLVQPFVYRRYIDFSAIEALQEMHANVQEDARRTDRLEDIKRGPGGIREIEFLAQCFQLLRGGREPLLQTPALLRALAGIESLGLLPSATVKEIRRDYVFLRQLENRIQAQHDQQTHRVPAGEDLERLARAMHEADPAALRARLDAVRLRVTHRFHDIFPARPEPPANPAWAEAWRHLRSDPSATDAADEGARDRPMTEFLRRLDRMALSSRARIRLDQFMPLLLHRLEHQGLDERTQHRVFDLVLAICQRSAYLVLLVQNPAALDRLLALFSDSAWVAETVTRFPALLDELIDPALGRQIPSLPDLRQSIDRLLAAAPGAEAALEGLNYLKLATTLRIAVAQLQNALPADDAQPALAGLAAAMLEGALELARRQMRERQGTIPVPGGDSLAVIAYGSFGAGELGYDSDLDIIFLFAGTDPASSGERSLPPERYYARLGQRILGFLTALTPSGRLYAVDTRLRPNGRAGSLVSSIEAFADYQQREAWTWELQALTRARFVAGCEPTGRAFEAIRRAVLSAPRDRSVMRRDIIAMRARMAQELGRPEAGEGALKRRAGGLVDIEFLIQYGVLSCAPDHSAVLESTASLHQLRALVTAGWIGAADAAILEAVARALRQQRMLAVLLPAAIAPAEVDTAAAAAIFARILGDTTAEA